MTGISEILFVGSRFLDSHVESFSHFFIISELEYFSGIEAIKKVKPQFLMFSDKFPFELHQNFLQFLILFFTVSLKV